MKKNSDRSISYILSFLIPVLIITAIMIVQKITPFGDKTLLIWDAKIQYKDYFGYLWDILHGNASIEYFAGKSLGGKMTGLFGYYLSSPLNIILYFFRKDQIPEFITFLTVLKIGLCGITSQIYVKKRFDVDIASGLILSTAYALMEYNIYYCRNIMWMDGVIMLPLVAYGVYSLIYEKNKNWLWISVAVVIISNWYTGYMVCLMAGVYFLYEYYIFTDGHIFQNIKQKVKDIFKFVLVMLGGVLTSMIILLPACSALIGGKATNNTVHGLSGIVNYDILYFLRGFDVSGYGNNKDIPMIFCGTILVIFVIYYFVSRDIKKKRKNSNRNISAIFIRSVLPA